MHHWNASEMWRLPSTVYECVCLYYLNFETPVFHAGWRTSRPDVDKCLKGDPRRNESALTEDVTVTSWSHEHTSTFPPSWPTTCCTLGMGDALGSSDRESDTICSWTSLMSAKSVALLYNKGKAPQCGSADAEFKTPPPKKGAQDDQSFSLFKPE